MMEYLENQLKLHPAFAQLIFALFKKSPLQKKRLEAFLSTQKENYWNFAEDLSQDLVQGLLRSSSEMNDGIESYNKMCMDILKEQIQFKKCGQYRVESAAAANHSVYANPDVMTSYLKGLLLSYLFWPNHFKMLEFFKEEIQKFKFKNYLEVGIGHGLFTAELLKSHPNVEPSVIDISETSLIAAKKLLTSFKVNLDRFSFIHGDYLNAQIEKGAYDFLVMGEVIEHVDDAPAFLKRTHHILSDTGVLFLTTCANCPAIDHVYHFKNTKEIRDLIGAAGFEVIADRAWASENVPEERWEQELVTINYAGFFKKRK